VAEQIPDDCERRYQQHAHDGAVADPVHSPSFFFVATRITVWNQ
jgi:hypothetical protein